jgi:hypothetical protein
MPVHIKARGEFSGKQRVKPGPHHGVLAADDLAQPAGFLDVADNQRGGVAPRIGKCGLRLLVLGLAVDDDGEALATVAAGRLPDLLHQHAGGIVLVDGDALAHEAGLVLIGRTEGRDDDDVVGGQRVP